MQSWYGFPAQFHFAHPATNPFSQRSLSGLAPTLKLCFFSGYNCPGKYNYFVMYHTAGTNVDIGTQYRVMFLLLSGQDWDKHKPVVVHVNNKLDHLTTTDVITNPKSCKAYSYLLWLHVDKNFKNNHCILRILSVTFKRNTQYFVLCTNSPPSANSDLSCPVSNILCQLLVHMCMLLGCIGIS